MTARAFPTAPALPLRAKLVLYTVAVLALVVAILGTALYVTLEQVLLDTTAEGLRTAAAAAITETLNGQGPGPPARAARADDPRSVNDPRTGQPPQPSPPQQPRNFPRGGGNGPLPAPPDDTNNRSLEDLARILTTREVAARTVDRDGAVRGDGPALAGGMGVASVAAPALDAAVYRAVAASGTGQRLRVESANGPLLVELVPLVRTTRTGAETVGVLQLSTPLAGVEAVLARVRLLLVLGTLVAVLLVAVLVVPLVGRALQPLRRVAATSREIAAGDLSQRVAVPPGGDELTDLARAFNEMVGKLDAAFATQRRFIADASHELRSPLTALGGGIEVLQAGAVPDDAARDRLLQLLEGEIGRMGRLVDDLLTLTRFDADPSHTLRRGAVNLNTLVAAVAEETQLLAPDREVRTTLPPGTVTLDADADRLRQLLLNLGANARAYTPVGGAITFALAVAGGAAVLSVADTGAGIAPDDLPRVWERFYRADPARARQAGQGGLGLGLAIVRAVAAAHGGEATIASTPGAGTTVTVTLPGATVAPAQSVAASAPRTGVPASA